MKVAIIGRTQILYETALALHEAGYQIVSIITAKAAPEYTRNENDFKDLAEKFNASFFLTNTLNKPEIEELFHGETLRYSHLAGPWQDIVNQPKIILIDSIGHLSSLYAHASLAIIGGGFGKGIHNILEPAAFGIPILFGPKWRKFREAESLVKAGASFPVNNFEDFSAMVKKLCADPKFRQESGDLALSYMKSQMGSSDLIIRCLLEKW